MCGLFVDVEVAETVAVGSRPWTRASRSFVEGDSSGSNGSLTDSGKLLASDKFFEIGRDGAASTGLAADDVDDSIT